MRWTWRGITTVVIAAALAVCIVLFVRYANNYEGYVESAAAPAATSGNPTAMAKPANELPPDEAFREVAESDALKLLADRETGHFQVIDKRSGDVWTSYPDPRQWPQEKIGGLWRENLRSPIVVEYMDISNLKAIPKVTNISQEQGEVTDWQTIEGGYRAWFVLRNIGIVVPFEVRISGDCIETKIIGSGLREENMSLLNVKLFPFFGAEQSFGQDGYMFIPDGSGALVRFKQNPIGKNYVFRELVYGEDQAFQMRTKSRDSVNMPVFGMKAGDKAFLAVIHEGAEYASIVASPSGTYGSYNWVAPEFNYRLQYFQNTSRNNDKGFVTYNKERFAGDRTVRYYVLDREHNDYSGMAVKYREYLMNVQNVKPFAVSTGKLPLYLNIIGADREDGLLMKRYLTGTTTAEAAQMLKRLYGLGVEQMSVVYRGWQQRGNSSYGGLLPVDKRIGGNNGMKQFVEFAHSLNVPVYLEANYLMNNTGDDGFSKRIHGMRNPAGTVMEVADSSNGGKSPLVSLKFAEKVLASDLDQYKKLGVDGLLFDNTIGSRLTSDYNTRYSADRSEAMQLQRDMLSDSEQVIGAVQAGRARFYALPYIQYIADLDDDYSYDLIVDEAVPFAQIALHGLVGYSSGAINTRDQFEIQFLRGIEYGAAPAATVMYAPSRKMKDAYSVRYYSLNYQDWEERIVEEYQRYNEALADVQDQYIVQHRTLSPGVKETTYANGTRTIVNYNLQPYENGELRVQAQDFIVVSGKGER